MPGQAESRLSAALDGMSLEVGVQDLESLAKHSDLVPRDGRVYVNAVAGAGAEARIQTAERLRELGYRPVPHIAARRMAAPDALNFYLSQLSARAGVTEALVIGGDVEEPLGPYSSALEVIQSGLLQEHGINRVGIAGYPDGHPAIGDAALEQALEDKLDACRKSDIKPYVVTQFSFQAESIINWCREMQTRHADLAIHAGIPGPARLATLMRFAKICGVQSSAKKLLKNKKVGLDLLRGAAPWEQLEAIGQYRLETGLPVTTHIFTFGGLREVVDWLTRVRSGGNGTNDLRI
jgi:methylenetetrahydrofolate reductase (NADPH)